MSWKTYFQDIKGELRHVSWPTKNQTINFTTLVIALSLATGVLLGLFDYLFSWVLKLLV